MKIKRTFKILLITTFISFFVSGITIAKTLALDEVEPVSFWALDDTETITLQVKNHNNMSGKKNTWTLEWSLTGDEYDFDTLITGKGRDNIVLSSDLAQIYFQLINYKSGEIIDIADLKFKTGAYNEDNIWEKLMIFWEDKNKMKKTTVLAIGDTNILQSGVADIPVPGAIWLMGSGLIGLVGLNRRLNAAKK